MPSRIDLADLVRGARAAAGPPPDHLRPLPFAPNPARLSALAYVPPGLAKGAALVVALHGCTQTAAAYDAGTGWSRLAEQAGFAVLLPEQTTANNAKRCWNWFDPAASGRGGHEAASIRAAIAQLVAEHGLDPQRVFVTGLSAGGAMTTALLAAYPEGFAAGASIAGLPVGVATSVPDAFEAMAGRRAHDPATLAARLRGTGGPAGARLPRLAIWQGGADRTVMPINAQQLETQWTTADDPRGPLREDAPGPGHRRRRWLRSDGSVAVETHLVDGLGHAVPIAGGEGTGRAGSAGPHIAECGISSTHWIAHFFGLVGEEALRPAPQATEAKPRAARERVEAPRATASGWGWQLPELPKLPELPEGGPGEVIRKALGAAGLLKGTGRR